MIDSSETTRHVEFTLANLAVALAPANLNPANALPLKCKRLRLLAGAPRIEYCSPIT
jgi:hypothetical protein